MLSNSFVPNFCRWLWSCNKKIRERFPVFQELFPRAVQILRIDDFIENQIQNRKNYRNLMNFEQIPNLSAM